VRGAFLGAADLARDRELSCDAVVIGSGAGGAVVAAGLAERGLSVIVLEEGPYATASDFARRDERWSMPQLYQESGTRSTADVAITVLQGRSVGGGTTINWTTCYRTPAAVLDHWRAAHGIETLSAAELAPHFDAVEARLGVAPWTGAPNANNRALLDGARALGFDVTVLRRNVRDCTDSGYCGLGCPYDAKQAMHLTYLPDAVERGAIVHADVRAERIVVEHDRVARIDAVGVVSGTDRATGVRLTIRPRLAVLSGGAINSPALLLRSGIAGGPVGRRTFLHPVIVVAGRYAHRVEGWVGAPQSVASRHHLQRGADEMGFFLEVAPVHPMLAAVALPGIGADKVATMAELPHLAATIALHVDGFLPGDDGGTVSLRNDGRVRLDYPILPALERAFRASHEVLARVHLAAGAEVAATSHTPRVEIRGEQDLSRLDSVRYGAHDHPIFTAHQMGGCAMGPDPAASVVDPHLRHHRVENLFVVDGSVFPTSLGVNPMESILAVAHWAVGGIAAAAA
jgi:choline dehydrogenase-like flavoprotein